MALRIGELARRAGVGTSTLRAWERRFQFPRPARSDSGHRLYEEADVGRIEAVVRLVSQGLTLPAAIARVAGAGSGAIPEGEGEALLYGQVLEAVGQGIWVSRDGRTRFANGRMAEMLRCSVDEVVARPVLDFLGPEEQRVTRAAVADVRAGRRRHLTHEVRRPDGSTFVADVDTTPLFDHAGRYEGAVAIVTDVTGRAEAERQTRLRAALLDAIGEAVVAVSPDGRIVYVNAAAERMFGWRAAEVIGRDGRRLAAPGAAGDALRVHERVTGGEAYSGSVRMTRADGTEFDGYLTTTPAYDGDGSVMGVIAVITDRTDEVRSARVRWALESQAETVAVLSARALTLHGKGGPSPVPQEAAEVTARLLAADAVAVHRVDRPTGALQTIAAWPSAPPAERVLGEPSFAYFVLLAGAPVVVDDTELERRFGFGARPTRAALGVPIHGPGGVCGIVTAERAAPDRFSHRNVVFLQGVAHAVGIALLP